MSYILDAIKKAERQRQQEQVPTLESIISARYPKKNHFDPKRIGKIAGIVIFLALIGWFHKPILRGIGQSLTVVVSWTGNLFSSSNSKENNQPSGNSDQQDNVDTQASDNSVNLSTGQKAALNQIKFTVISYSKDPNKRFVMDGSRVLREGDTVQGFPILAIEKNSIVVDVGGQNYQVKF